MIKVGYEEILAKEGNEKDFNYKGFECRIRRTRPESSGHLCGYLVFPKKHELYEKDYDEIEAYYGYNLPSHGGLTFSGVVENEFWVGFDCAHLYDLLPCYVEGYELFSLDDDIYRNMPYVEQTLKNMVDFILEN